MTFKPKNLSPMHYQQNFSFWRYDAGEDDIENEGYFDRASQLREGDAILVSMSGPKTRIYTVTKADKGCVIVKQMGKEHAFTARDKPVRKEKTNGDEEI